MGVYTGQVVVHGGLLYPFAGGSTPYMRLYAIRSRLVMVFFPVKTYRLVPFPLVSAIFRHQLWKSGWKFVQLVVFVHAWVAFEHRVFVKDRFIFKECSCMELLDTCRSAWLERVCSHTADEPVDVSEYRLVFCHIPQRLDG